MNLVQKFPMGLCLACLMMMSSCSKEDIQTPEPQTENPNANSNLREGLGQVVLLVAPTLATKGPTGSDVYPSGWERDNSDLASFQTLPTGTSSLAHLWGNPLLPWDKPLPPIPSALNSGSIVTFPTYCVKNSSPPQTASSVVAKIKNLKPGKKYLISFKVASTIRFVPGHIANYAGEVSVMTSFPNETGWYETNVDLTGKKAEWVTKSLLLYAKESEAHLTLKAYAPQGGGYAYAHIYVDSNSIKEVN